MSQLNDNRASTEMWFQHDDPQLQLSIKIRITSKILQLSEFLMGVGWASIRNFIVPSVYPVQFSVDSKPCRSADNLSFKMYNLKEDFFTKTKVGLEIISFAQSPKTPSRRGSDKCRILIMIQKHLNQLATNLGQ